MMDQQRAGPLYGWTFHQSHDQATVLFLVPQKTSASDLDIRIASDHVFASTSNGPPILHAKLYGRVNTETSTWRIANSDRTRKPRSRSFARAFQAATPVSASGSAEMPHRGRLQGESTSRQSGVPSDSTSPGSQSSGSHVHAESPPASHSSLSASIVSLQSGSSYEVLSHSTPSSQPPGSLGPATEWSSGSSDLGSSDSADASLNQSVVLSDPGDLRMYGQDVIPHTDTVAGPSVRRSQSNCNLAASSSSVSAPSSSPFAAPHASSQAGPPEVRLVTLHLDKVDTGIWPLLVVGPAPLQNEALPARLTRLVESELPRNGLVTDKFIQDRILKRRGVQQQQQQRSAAQLQLNQALEEALSAFGGGDRVLAAIRRGSTGTLSANEDADAHFDEASRTSMDSDEDLGPNTSTLSINTIASDESATVLGSRVSSLAGTSASLRDADASAAAARQEHAKRVEEEDEISEAWRELEVLARYNMDPTTLSLIGLQSANGYSSHGNSSMATQLARGFPSSIPEAFEYFARAWRAANVSLATERLVQDFLPLLPSTSHGAGYRDYNVLHDRFAEALEPSLYSRATALPATDDVIANQLQERLHSHSYMSHRQRLVASLGGPKALARLYVSYARLHLPSLASNRSPLAFPYGQLTSPFVSGGHGGPYQFGNLRRRPAPSTSSRTPSIASVTLSGVEGGANSPSKTRAPNSPTVAESSRVASPDHAASNVAAARLDFSDLVLQSEHSIASQPDPFYFFREACLLDSDVATQISAEEWLEALLLALESEDRRAAELDGLAQAGELGSMAGDSESGGLTFESDSETHQRRLQRRSQTRSQHWSTASAGGSGGFFNLAWAADTEPNQTGRKRSGKTPRRTEKNKRYKERRISKSGREHQEAGVINFVSGAALLGVALAGSVAALGWWRRTSAALNSSA